MAHLWTNAPPPDIYVERALCERFGCLPSALRRERAVDVLQLLTCLDVEAKVVEIRNQKRRAPKK